LLPVFVRLDQPEVWLRPEGNAALRINPGFKLEAILMRTCMYRVAKWVADAQVGSVDESYDPRRLGAIARRCVAKMAIGAANGVKVGHSVPEHSPLRRRGRRRGVVLPLPSLGTASIARNTEPPPLPTPVQAPSPEKLQQCSRFAEAFYLFVRQCTAVSPTRYK
jgi:hypothetical protein